jgi:hypothetical protein
MKPIGRKNTMHIQPSSLKSVAKREVTKIAIHGKKIARSHDALD